MEIIIGYFIIGAAFLPIIPFLLEEKITENINLCLFLLTGWPILIAYTFSYLAISFIKFIIKKFFK